MHYWYMSVLYSVIFSSMFAKHIDFRDCGNKEIVYIDIEPCAASRCDISLGKVFDVSIQFKAIEDSLTLKAVANARAPGLESAPLPTMDLCSEPGACPVKEGSIVTAKTRKIIPGFLLPINGVNINTKLIGDGGKQLVCADFVVNIVI